MEAIDPWKTHKTNDGLVLSVYLLTYIITHLFEKCKHNRMTSSQWFSHTKWVVVLLPMHPFSHFWDTVSRLHSVVMTGHGFVRMSSQLANIITTYSLFKNVSYI